MNFAMIASNTNRARAYLQNLIQYGFIPSKVIYLDVQNITLVEQLDEHKLAGSSTKQKSIVEAKEFNISFDQKKSILESLIEVNIPYEHLETTDINSNLVQHAIISLEEKAILFAGPGGQILDKKLLTLGKKIFHVHPGYLPKYRGSTTIYYSYLVEKIVGASVICFDAGIDTGPLLFKNKYTLSEKNIDFDHVLDPIIRTKVLLEFMEKNSKFPDAIQNSDYNGNTFYIIHPLLKHLSRLSDKALIND
jgi:methionyl-tRNA formyltransferase